MKGRAAYSILTWCMAVGVVEVLTHWLLGHHTASLALQLYVLHEPPSGHTVYQGLLDQVLPSVTLGFVVGWAGFPAWTPRRLAVTAAVVALYLNWLEGLYRLVIGPRLYDVSFGAAPLSLGAFAMYPSELVVILPVVGAFVYGGYVFRRDWKRRKSR